MPIWTPQFLLNHAADVHIRSTYLCRLLCCHTKYSVNQSALRATSNPGSGQGSHLSGIDFLRKGIWQTWRTLSRICVNLHRFGFISVDW